MQCGAGAGWVFRATHSMGNHTWGVFATQVCFPIMFFVCFVCVFEFRGTCFCMFSGCVLSFFVFSDCVFAVFCVFRMFLSDFYCFEDVCWPASLHVFSVSFTVFCMIYT